MQRRRVGDGVRPHCDDTVYSSAQAGHKVHKLVTTGSTLAGHKVHKLVTTKSTVAGHYQSLEFKFRFVFFPSKYQAGHN